MEIFYWRDLLRPVFKGKKVIIIGGPVAASTGLARDLLDLGAQKPFILADSVGTGELPSKDEAEWHSMELRAPDVISEIRMMLNALADPPPEARAAMDRYDPYRKALVVGSFFYEGDSVAGRRNYAPRWPEWRQLEDKVVVDALFRRAGVDHAPSQVTPATAEALIAAAETLDEGFGTAWAGDSQEGFNGGATYLRWVRNRDHAADAARFFEVHCNQVRVMPFLEGVPCSIHGLVFEGEVIALRPVEMLTLRRVGDIRLFYAGSATFWDPSPDDREAMRGTACKIGRRLKAEVNFRGAFTVDGIMSEHGFRPSEVNTRWGQGLGTIARSLRDLPLFLLSMAAIARESFDFRADELKELLIASADANRTSGAIALLEIPRESTEEHPLVEIEEGYRIARDGKDADATLSIGPSGVGGFMGLELRADRYEAGTFIAPKVVAAFDLADREFGAGIGPLEPARPVR
jgi:hypothetical protein